MRHGDKVKKLSRTTSHRKALYRNLIISLLKNERIITTVEKAKAVKPFAEKLITKVKNAVIKSESINADTANKDREMQARIVIMNAKRNANVTIKDRKIMDKLFTDIALRYKTRNGGYTRVIRLGARKSDAAERAILELVLE